MEEAAKRKRLSDPEGQPDAKRPAQEQQQGLVSKDPRAALAEVYAAYDALHRNNYHTGDENDIKTGEAHFAVLLSAVQGDKAVQRLAIRLLPKFALRFPSLISDAAAALQDLSSLDLNTNDTTTAVDNGDVASNIVPFESLLGLKRMLLALATTTKERKNIDSNIAAVAEGALHFALEQQQQFYAAANNISAEIGKERRDLLNEISKIAFIACPRAVLMQINEFSSSSSGGSNKVFASDLGLLALQFVEEQLLAKIQDQDADIREALISLITEMDAAEKEEEDELNEKVAQMPVLLFVLKNFNGAAVVGSGNDKMKESDNTDNLTWEVASLQSLIEYSTEFSSGAALVDGLTTVLETLSPPLAATTTTATTGSKRRRNNRTASPSPRVPGRSTYPSNNNITKNTPPLPPYNNSSRPPRDGGATRISPLNNQSGPPSKRERGTSARGGGGVSKWSSRGPTPTLEEGELGELDDASGDVALQQQQPPLGSSFQKQQREAITTTARRSSRSPGRDTDRYRDREYRDGERERERERGGGRRRGSYSPERGGRGDRDRGDRGGGEYRDRGPPLPRPPSGSHQKVPGRGMPPLEYAGKALWVGQVPLGHSAERELIAAFSRYGPLMSHHIISRSSCAFINYVDLECAIEARERLDGARVAGSTLVVEFKGEKKYWEKMDRERERGGDRERGGGDVRDEYRDHDRGTRDTTRDGRDIRDRDASREYRGNRDRDRGGGGGDYGGPSPFTTGFGGPPLHPLVHKRTRSRSRSPSPVLGGGGGGPVGRRRSFDAGGGPPPGVNEGGWIPIGVQSGRLYSTMSEQLPSLPLPHSASQQQQHQPPGSQFQPASAPVLPSGATTIAPIAPSAIAWQGSLGKSRQPQAEVACLYSQSSPSTTGWAAAEPAGWPAMLDVQNRISTAYVLNTLLPALPPTERAVLRLIPAPGQPNEAAKLQAFSSYLQGKQRTGVVTLGPGPQPGAPRKRMVYLIPASAEACQAVGMDKSVFAGGEQGMFAVVAAKIDEAGGMH